MLEPTSILIIYTGGTIGMIMHPDSKTLKPFNFDNIDKQIPELKRFHYQLDFHCFDPLMDSSNMNPEVWIQLVRIIKDNYENYDGFVVLHGSDTMAYTASALSFLLENLNKPVIFTGSQLPLGVLRTDGRENFITAIELAAAKEEETPLVPEVCIYFENQLMRANRTMKYNAANFNAFVSGNYPLLAEAGVYLKYNHEVIHKPNFKKLKIHTKMSDQVGILKLFPGINPHFVDAVLQTPKIRGIVMETFGAGNASTEAWFIKKLRKAIEKGIYIINVSQCLSGSVEHGKYETSLALEEIGVISGKDISTEAAITKLMYVLGQDYPNDLVDKLLRNSLRGEMTT